MVFRKINEYIRENDGIERETRYQRIVFLTDSKGSYMRSEAQKLKLKVEGTDEYIKLVWWICAGRNTKEGVDYLVDNLHRIKDDVKTLVIFWHFTCDITVKPKLSKFIYQQYQSTSDLIAGIEPHLQRLKKIHLTEKFIDLAILEVPPVWTKDWNKAKGYDRWCEIDDTTIHKQAEEVNRLVREINSELNYCSPRFVCDFVHRRRKRKAGAKETLQYLESSLLKDGVHPVSVVALKWTLRVGQSIATSNK